MELKFVLRENETGNPGLGDKGELWGGRSPTVRHPIIFDLRDHGFKDVYVIVRVLYIVEHADDLANLPESWTFNSKHTTHPFIRCHLVSSGGVLCTTASTHRPIH